jgi:flavin reductase (DIM6/NTAB) family NADH-FMN oxidoreductase RutF
MMQNKHAPTEISPFDESYFRKALSQFATGVTVITARIADGHYIGLTASSFNSVSLAPPLVLWSLGRANSMPVFASCSHYAINVLSAGQEWVAQQFASKRENRFEGVESLCHQMVMPVLKGAAAWFECKNRSRIRKVITSFLLVKLTHCFANPKMRWYITRDSLFRRVRHELAEQRPGRLRCRDTDHQRIYSASPDDLEKQTC